MEYKKLKDIADLIGGYAFKSDKYVNSGIRIIRIANVQDGYISDDYPCFYPLNKEVEIGNAILKENDLLMSLTGNVGRVAILSRDLLPAGLNQRVECIRPKKPSLKPYLYYYFRSNHFKQTAEKNSSGIAQLNMSTVWLSEHQVPIYESKKTFFIVKQLSIIDDLIAKEQKQLALYDELIKSRFIEMFMDGEKDKYPLSNWEDVLVIKHGKDYKKNIVESGGYPVYGSGGFMGVYVDKYLVNEQSTIIGRKGTIDKPIFVREKFWNVDTAFGIEVNNEYLNPIFFFIRSTLYDLKSFSTSTTLPSMTKERLHKVKIGVPPIELQNEFASFVKQIDKSKFIIQKRINLYKELLDKKMAEFFE